MENQHAVDAQLGKGLASL